MCLKQFKIDNGNRIFYEQGHTVVDFNCEYLFSEFFVFEKEKIILAIGGLSNKECSFLGKIYSYNGREIMVLPFPKDGGLSDLGVYIHYRWASETNNGIKFVFGTSSPSHPDFWYDFNVDLMKYTETGDLYC